MLKYVDIAAHILLGLVFAVFGLGGLFHLFPQPELNQEAAMYMSGLVSTGYFMTLLKVVEAIGGILLLTRRWVPLALVLLAPVVVHIFLFHAFLAPEGLPMAVALVVLEAYLGFVVYRKSFKTVLAAKQH
jgi:uncharacterized membrane protein YphA (DoxX/SURF4 family)